MIHPDFRALCARFVDAVGLLCGSGESPARRGQRLILTTHVDGLEELASEARAALAAPQQGAPMPFNNRDIQRITDDYWDKDKCTLDWVGVANEILRRYGAQAVQQQQQQGAPSDLVTEALRDQWFEQYQGQTRHPLGLLPVAAEHGYRLGYRAAQAVPVAVNKRLPGEGDCDAKGYFWTWCDLDQQWERIHLNSMNWENRQRLVFTHWLPHWALPLPLPEAKS